MPKRYLRPLFCPSCGQGGRESGAIFDSHLNGTYFCKRCGVRYSVTIVKEEVA